MNYTTIADLATDVELLMGSDWSSEQNSELAAQLWERGVRASDELPADLAGFAVERGIY